MGTTMPPVHPAAAIYPLMADEEIAGLALDIKRRGQRIPILMTDGQILDGRNRWRACALAEVEPVTVEWDRVGDPLQVAESLNSQRRHLTPTQRAAVAAAKVAYYEAQAAAASAVNLKRGEQKPEGVKSAPSGKRNESARSVAKAAKAEGAGVGATKALKSIKDKAPEVLDLARDGLVTTEGAKRTAALPPEERRQVVERVRAGDKGAVPPKPPGGELRPTNDTRCPACGAGKGNVGVRPGRQYFTCTRCCYEFSPDGQPAGDTAAKIAAGTYKPLFDGETAAALLGRPRPTAPPAKEAQHVAPPAIPQEVLVLRAEVVELRQRWNDAQADAHQFASERDRARGWARAWRASARRWRERARYQPITDAGKPAKAAARGRRGA